MKNPLEKIVVLIPAYNPTESLIYYIEELIKQKVCHIIVVNDGSKIECNQYFEQAKVYNQCIVINHIVNQGKGRALKTGFNYYLENFIDDNYIGLVTADCDGQHMAGDTVNVAYNLYIHRDIIILGTRNFKIKDVPFKSKYGNIITTQIFKLLYGVKINDTQTGLRGINNQDIRRFLLLSGEKFDFEINMLISCAIENKNTHFLEIPIQTIYEKNNSETHFNPLVDSIKIYLVMFKRFFSFIISGTVSFGLDIILFIILSSYVFFSCSSILQIFLSTIIARIISSILNFLLNEKLVFKSKRNLQQIIIYYWGLCIIQMLTSAFLVYLIDSYFIGNTVIVKIIVDFVLFFISYKIQNELIFKKQ